MELLSPFIMMCRLVWSDGAGQKEMRLPSLGERHRAEMKRLLVGRNAPWPAPASMRLHYKYQPGEHYQDTATGRGVNYSVILEGRSVVTAANGGRPFRSSSNRILQQAVTGIAKSIPSAPPTAPPTITAMSTIKALISIVSL